MPKSNTSILSIALARSDNAILRLTGRRFPQINYQSIISPAT